MGKPKGYVVWESRQLVMILIVRSANVKTGDMSQSYILRKDRSPVKAVKDGSDKANCGNCPHRRKWVAALRKWVRSCYVNVGQAPLAVWNAWRAGKYPRYVPAEHGAQFTGRSLRIGSYGDPALVPVSVWEELLTHFTGGHTGYTHQWRECDPAFARIVMASADSQEDTIAANRKGYRAFAVVGKAEVLPKGQNALNATLCVNSSHGKQCADCTLCDGNPREVRNPRNVYIQAHGVGAGRIALSLV